MKRGLLNLIMKYLFLLVVLFLIGCQNKEDELFILPNDYIGPIAIVFDSPKGDSIQYDEQMRRVYNIPQTGILHTQFLKNGNSVSKYDNKNFQYKSGKKIPWDFPITDSIRSRANADSLIVFLDSRVHFSTSKSDLSGFIDLFFIDTLKNSKNYTQVFDMVQPNL